MKIPYPVCLSIAGFDNCGASGLLADVKTFHSLGCYGLGIISAITVQTIQSVESIFAIPSREFEASLSTTLETFSINSLKLGMIYKKNYIKMLIRYLRNIDFPIVVDPIIKSSSGKIFIEDEALSYLEKLIRISRLVTPNFPELLFLLNRNQKENYSIEEIKNLCFEFYDKFHTPVLLKGGHIFFEKRNQILDIFYDGKMIYIFQKNRKIKENVRGTGCVLSSAITAYLAKGYNMLNSIKKGISYIDNKINTSFLYDEKNRIIFH